MPVSGTLPVLVSVNAWAGSRAQAAIPRPVPGQLAAWTGAHVAGVSEAAITGATPVPVSPTGEPVTATLARIVRVPVTVPRAVGVNTTLMVQVAPFARVAVQVPPAVPAGREKTAFEKVSEMPVPGAVPVLCSVKVCAALV